METIREDMTDEEIIDILNRRFDHSADEILNMVCPMCGNHTINLGGFKQFGTLCETEVDHCDDENWVPPFRPVLVCNNPECVAHGKGYWSDCELDWYRYGKNDADLVGEPLPYGTKVASIYRKIDMRGLRHESYEYRKGAFIGPNHLSKTVKWYDDNIASKLSSLRYNFHTFANKHLGTTYWVGFHDKEKSKLGMFMTSLRTKLTKNKVTTN